MSFPALGIWAGFDDLHFIVIAGQLGQGHWLGQYDHLTLAKGMFYPLFIILNHMTGLPLKLSEHLIYLGACWLTAHMAARLLGRNTWFLPVLVVLAFLPVVWTPEFARVLRDSLYLSLSLALFSLTVLYLIEPRRSRGIALGLLAAAFWLTREEGVWMLPALAILTGYGLLIWRRQAREASPQPSSRALLTLTLGRLAWPGLAFTLAVGAVNLANLAQYGVFRNNDLKTSPFVDAYGALARIKHDHWQRYVVFPRDARQRAYQVSAAARELQAFYEGDPGRFWVTVSQHYPPPWGCAQDRRLCNTEILSGWFVWTLRDAVANLGHYQSARQADAYYRRLAREINDACQAGRIPCHAPHASLSPIWRHHYLADTWKTSHAVLLTLVGLNRGHVGVPPSYLDTPQRRMFEFALNSPVSAPDDPSLTEFRSFNRRDALRHGLSGAIAKTYAALSVPAFVLALAAYAGLLLTRWTGPASRASGPVLILMTALLVAVATRITLLAFLEATAVPSNNLLYLSATLPFYLLFITLAIGHGLATAWDILRHRSARPANPAAP